jgi:dihydroxyacetone kinase
MEVGLGIHGEPGLEKAKVKPCKDTAKIVAEKILACIDAENLKAGKKLAVLINNLGAVPPMEMTILVKDIFMALPDGVDKYLVGPAPLMTSLDMNGISVTLMPVNDEQMLKYMLDGCGAHCAWPHVSDVPCNLATPASYPKDPLSANGNEDSTALKQDDKADKIIKAVCEFLISKE